MCREFEWGEEYCFSDYFVYFVNIGIVKVGIICYIIDVVFFWWMD